MTSRADESIITMTKVTAMSTEDDRRARANARTTRMLLLVVVLFLVTEFPQGAASLVRKAMQVSAGLPEFPLGVVRVSSCCC